MPRDKGYSGAPLPMKGPHKLSIDTVKDIVRNRGIKAAVKILADKYGISQDRVRTIWKEYYGGTRLSDYKTGLKKDFPDTDMVQVGRHVRVGNKKLIVEEPRIRAQPTRRLNTKISKTATAKELNLDDLESADDSTAEIVAGEIAQGNDNEDLIGAMYDLIESNKHLSESAQQSLIAARDYYERTKRKYKKLKRGKYTQADSSDAGDYDDADDSTKAFSGTSCDETVYETDEDDWGESDELPGGHPGQGSRIHSREAGGPPIRRTATQGGLRYAVIAPGGRGQIPEAPAGRHQQRAQPVYKLSCLAEESEPYEGPENRGRPGRARAAVSRAEQDASEGRVQQDHLLYNTQLGGQPGRGQPLYRQGSQGSIGNKPALVRPI